MKKLLLPLFLLLASFVSFAKNDEDSTAIMVAKYLKYRDSVEQALKYETGTIKLSGDMVTLNVPKGFKYLNKEQSNFVLTNLWGNPPQDYVLGMLFPEKGGPLRDTSYAFVISFDEIGYVKDEDADKIDYSKMLKDQQEEEPKENAERVKQGYDPIHFIGWAQQPFYDKENKTLHWAKELHFGAADDSGSNTLNYDVRILGRKGVLSLNAVGTMENLDLVKNDIGQVLHIATFTDGNKYSDFDPGVDKVAAWTIGGLVAGKVLAKVGILAVLGKFFVAAWKFIVIGIVAAWGAIMKFFKRKKPEDEVVYEPAPVEPEPVQDAATNEETNA